MLFANDASCSKAGITFSGSQNTVTGYSHSNGAFVVSGSKNTFGASDAVCTPSITGSANTFNGAAAPAQGQLLGFPETFDQSTICSQPGVHTGTTLTISSGTPSGIYCYTGSITLSESNLTATVTFVAPSVSFSGSSLNLTPAYQDLLAYDTNTTVGNTGFTVSGSSIVTHGATVYAPAAAISLSGAKYSWDGMLEGDTITFSGAQSTDIGTGSEPIGTPFTITGPTPTLYPGAAAQKLNLTINNPNPGSISVNSLTVTVSGVSGGSNSPLACTTGDFNVIQINPSALPFTAPPGTSTLSADGVSTANQPSLQMLDLPHNQNGCAHATLSLTYAGSANG